MYFSVNPGYGKARVAESITFVDDSGPVATMIAAGPTVTANQAFIVVRNNQEQYRSTDVSAAGQRVASLAHEFHHHSMVVNPHGGRTLRGDEARTADVYPPGQHPRIIVADS